MTCIHVHTPIVLVTSGDAMKLSDILLSDVLSLVLSSALSGRLSCMCEFGRNGICQHIHIFAVTQFSYQISDKEVVDLRTRDRYTHESK